MSYARERTMLLSAELEIHDYCSCGVFYAMPVAMVEQRRKDGQLFYCPNGHGLSFAETEEVRQRKRAEAAEALARHADDQRRAAERDARTVRGHLTRERKRVSNGICPCCRRSFVNLQRHMSNQHPDHSVREVSP